MLTLKTVNLLKNMAEVIFFFLNAFQLLRNSQHSQIKWVNNSFCSLLFFKATLVFVTVSIRLTLDWSNMKGKQSKKVYILYKSLKNPNPVCYSNCPRDKKTKQTKLKKIYKKLPEVSSHVCIDLKIISIWRQNILTEVIKLWVMTKWSGLEY